jgi:HEPN domain-containing protein
MFANGQYIHAVFMCHLAVEKALKGLLTSKTEDMPPRTHNLVFLAGKIEGVVLPEDLLEFLTTMNNVSVPTRYPDELKQMRKVYTKTKTAVLLERSRELVKWLKSKL